MSSWSAKRKAAYLATFTIVFLVSAIAVFFLIFYRKPTCFDGKQNQNEAGIDCGGNCEKVCSFQAVSPNILWARTFKVSTGVYNSVAYVENPNREGSASNVPYVFRIFDDRNILIKEAKGRINIPAGKIFPVFEAGVLTGNRIPKYTFFEFEKDPNWVAESGDGSISISVLSHNLANTFTSPKLEATLFNPSLEDAFNVDVVAIVYDIAGNAIASSRTIVDKIAKEESEKAVFTWPEPFSGEAVKVEIFPLLNLYN